MLLSLSHHKTELSLPPYVMLMLFIQVSKHGKVVACQRTLLLQARIDPGIFISRHPQKNHSWAKKNENIVKKRRNIRTNIQVRNKCKARIQNLKLLPIGFLILSKQESFQYGFESPWSGLYFSHAFFFSLEDQFIEIGKTTVYRVTRQG